MGHGRRRDDDIPYRAMGPVTEDEYLSRAERYDKQLTEDHGLDLTGKSTAAKLALLRQRREARYDKLRDAVYHRRGWTPDGIPTLETVRRLKIDLPEVLAVLETNGIR